MDDDSTLLRNFIATRDEQAFALLVRRYVDLVYSAARRQVREDAAAHDVTQQVFVLLAERARTIRDGEAVAGWLLVTTRYVALNAIRTEARRRRHEREAAVMQQKRQSESDPAWQQVGPLLDEVVAKLKREDRDALALRYFQGRSVADVAAAMGVSHDAAQKRLSRAVERLRETFARRGVTTSAEALSTMLMANALVVAPAMLGTTVAGAALATATATTMSGSAKGAVAIMAMAKTKVAAASVAAVLLVGVTGTIAYQQIRTPAGRSRQVRVDPAAAAPAPTPLRRAQTQPVNPNWRAGFEAVYLLQPDETLKRVPRPWIADRVDFYRTTTDPAQVEAIPDGPDVFVAEQTAPSAAGLSIKTATFGGSGKSVRDVLLDVVGVSPEEVDLPAKVKGMTLPGDWVVRAGSTLEARMAGFAGVLAQATGKPYEFVVEPRERDAIVVSGKYAFRPMPNTEQQPGGTTYLTLAPPGKRENSFSGAGGGLREVFEYLGELTNLPVILETTLPQRGASSWRIDQSASPYMGGRKEMDPAQVAVLVANVASQTSLTLKRERRVVPTWVPTTAPTTAPVASPAPTTTFTATLKR